MRNGKRKPGVQPVARRKNPNYLLLLVGIALLSFEVLASGSVTMSPITEAALLALGFTITLYGVYPYTVMKGTFSGILGTVAVTGPAAVGILIFGVALKTLGDDAMREAEFVNAQRDAKGLVTLIARDPTYGMRKIERSMVELLDVDSFQGKRIIPVVSALRETLDRAGVSANNRDAEVRRLLFAVIPKLRLPEPYNRNALLSIDMALAGDPGADGAWKDAVDGAAELSPSSEKFMDRVKKLPFAIVLVAGENLSIVSEGSSLIIDAVTYVIPVIANPDLDVVRMTEAVTLKRMEQVGGGVPAA